MKPGPAQAALTRLLFYALIVVVAATSLACLHMADTAALVIFFLYGFVPFALGAVFGMHVLLCRTPSERRLMEFTGLIALAAVLIAVPLFDLDRRALVLYAGAALATVSVILQLRFIATSRDRMRELRIMRLQESLIVPMAVAVTPFFLWVSSFLNPTYDLSLYAYEASYGFQPSAVAVIIAQSVPGLSRVLQAVYDGLPLAV